MLGLNPGFRDLPLHTMLPGFVGLGGGGPPHLHGGGGGPQLALSTHNTPVSGGGGQPAHHTHPHHPHPTGLPNMWPFIWSHISK